MKWEYTSLTFLLEYQYFQISKHFVDPFQRLPKSPRPFNSSPCDDIVRVDLSNYSQVPDKNDPSDGSQPANNNTDIIGENGDIAHLRKYIGKKEAMNSNKIYWITDRTPIEFCLPSDRTYIQYFRIDTHQLPVWYEGHSTKNSLGVIPNSNITRIVKSYKS